MKNEYEIDNDIVMMNVQGQKVNFDLADFPAVNQFNCWKKTKATSISAIFRKENQQMGNITLHKLLTGSKFVKWLNGNVFDFRRENMEPSKKEVLRPHGLIMKGNKYQIENDVLIILMETKDGEVREAYADLEDYPIISQYTWNSNPKHGYVQTKERLGKKNSKGLYLHRLIMGAAGRENLVDHINGNKADNRKCNLRISDNSENLHNTHRHRNEKVGIHKEKWGWRAQIKINGQYYRKAFKTFDDAVEQYRKWQQEFNPSGLNGESK